MAEQHHVQVALYSKQIFRHHSTSVHQWYTTSTIHEHYTQSQKCCPHFVSLRCTSWTKIWR